MKQLIKALLFRDIDKYTDDELKDVTISAKIHGVFFYVDTENYNSKEEIIEAIKNEQWKTVDNQ